MRIGAVIGVKDEAELIAPCIERLRAVGVEGIVVLDDRSTDGTAEIVTELAASSPEFLHLVEFAPVLKENLHRDGPALSALFERHDPEWILFTDADEFWVPMTDRLADILCDVQADAVTVDRFNVPLVDIAFQPTLSASVADYMEAPVIARREQITSAVLREDDTRRWIMNSIMPKMICRADRLLAFDAGAHTAQARDGTPIRSTVPTDLVILHTPLTSFSRFQRKADNAKKFFERWIDDYPGESAWHWKRWVELADKGELAAEFERQRMGAAEVAQLRASKVVMTTQELLAERVQ